MKICPSCNTKCVDTLKYCPKCKRYLGHVDIIAEKDYYENRQRVQSKHDHNPNVECPYCHSTDTKKISGLSKAGSVAMFGIFALGKTTKQWHCNNCRSDF